MQRIDDVDGGSRALPGLRAGAASCAAVVLFVLVGWHLNVVPQNNEPENVRRSIQHISFMAVLATVAFGAAIAAIVRGAFSGGNRGKARAIPILLGLFGVVAAAVCALVIFGALLATRDV